MQIKNKKVTIIGFGRSGEALARLIFHFGGQVRISDAGNRDDVTAAVKKAGLWDKVTLEYADHTKEFIQESDLIVVSPGVAVTTPVFEWAKEKDISVVGEIEFAFWYCPCPIVAITGSNGKTTTSTLIDKILQKGGKKSCLCGNIGSPFSKYVLDLTKEQIVVLEISSFQLETIKSFHPYVAVFLNCTQNHLDRHRDMKEYFDTKARIFMNQTQEDYAVLNAQDDKGKEISHELLARVEYFNSDEKLKRYADENANFLAARNVAEIFKIPDAIIKSTFAEFIGVEHRLEWVREVDGVDFINDSKATTAEAGGWALSQMQKPIVMICGGRDKNIDFTVLHPLIKEKVKQVIVLGEAKEKIQRAFQGLVPVEMAETLEDAVQKARERSKKGDCILMSPMCTSFDMFANFEERGKIFKQIVRGLS